MTKRALSFTFLALFLALASLTGCSSDGQDGSGLAVNPLGSSLTNDSHESAASRVAAGEPAVTAVEPPLPTTGHAFTSTAPTASSEEPSSGSADVATVPATIRPAYSWTHENITETAFNDAWNAVFPTLSPRPTEAMKCRLRDIIVSANKKQDSGDAANDLRRHYNRLTSASTFSAKMAVDQAFADYLTAEESLVIRHLTFGAAAPDAWIHADTALQAAGRVLHGYRTSISTPSVVTERAAGPSTCAAASRPGPGARARPAIPGTAAISSPAAGPRSGIPVSTDWGNRWERARTRRTRAGPPPRSIARSPCNGSSLPGGRPTAGSISASNRPFSRSRGIMDQGRRNGRRKG